LNLGLNRDKPIEKFQILGEIVEIEGKFIKIDSI
jgi:hypothetical protein